MRPSLPEFIRVGPFDYSVRYPTEVEKASLQAAEKIGTCHRHDLLILVVPDLHPVKEAEVLVHEILHAVYDASCLGDTRGEEELVSRMGYAMLQVLRDNPDLTSYIEAVFNPRPKKRKSK